MKTKGFLVFATLMLLPAISFARGGHGGGHSGGHSSSHSSGHSFGHSEGHAFGSSEHSVSNSSEHSFSRSSNEHTDSGSQRGFFSRVFGRETHVNTPKSHRIFRAHRRTAHVFNAPLRNSHYTYATHYGSPLSFNNDSWWLWQAMNHHFYYSSPVYVSDDPLFDTGVCYENEDVSDDFSGDTYTNDSVVVTEEEEEEL